jgi:transglutaminase-like putative cysteine protease
VNDTTRYRPLNETSSGHHAPVARVPVRPGTRVAADDHHPLTEFLDLLPLYAAALAVTLCGIAAVNITVDDANLASLTVLLCSLGFAVSLALRMLRVDPNQAMYPLLGITLFITLQRLLGGEGLLDFMVGIRGSSVQPDVVLATLLSWLVVLRSFSLLTNYSLLFCAVPTIAMLGLTGSSNLDPEIVVYFFLFLLATIFMVGYEHHLRLREESARADRPSLRSHASTALALFVAVAAVGGALTLASRPILSRISPLTAPILRKAQSLPTFSTSFQSGMDYLPVGAGPISLSDTPVLDVRGAGDVSLWRTRILGHYTKRGWQRTDQPEDPEFPAQKNGVAFTAPRVPGLDERANAGQYSRFDYPPDSQRQQRIAPKLLTQEITTLQELPQFLPLPGRPRTLVGPFSSANSDAAGVVRVQEVLSRGLSYQITADISQPSAAQLRQVPAVDPQTFYQQEYLELPLGTEHVQALARSLAAGHSNAYDKALAMERYIERNCSYTLQEEVTPPEMDVVDYYLFTTKEGACDLAGSAMAILCRAVGIPARAVVGYLEGVEPAPGRRTLRENDAHLWVELFFPGYGWVTFNPQPPSNGAPTNLPGQVARSARKLWRGVLRRGFAALFTLGLTLVFLGAAARPGLELWWAHLQERRVAAARARRGDTTAVLALRYRQMIETFARSGWQRAPSETPAAFLARLRSEMPADLAPALATAEVVTDTFIRARYGEESIPADAVADTAHRVQSLPRLLRRKRA